MRATLKLKRTDEAAAAVSHPGLAFNIERLRKVTPIGLLCDLTIN
jgi:hypothetical protein